MRKFLNWLKKHFSKKTVTTPTMPTPAPAPKPLPRRAIVLIVGHHTKKVRRRPDGTFYDVLDLGAVNYAGVSEFDFNSQITHEIMNALPEMRKIAADRYGYELVMYEYIKTPNAGYATNADMVADFIKRNEINVALEFHFNAFKPETSGTEILVAQEKARPEFVNDMKNLCADICRTYGLPNRGIKTVERGERGGGVIHRIENVGCDAAIIEPAFTHDKQFFENPEKYVNILKGNILEILAHEN